MIKGLDRFKTKAEALIFVRENVHGCISAERYLQEHVPKESYYQKKIMDYVKTAYPDAFVWKEAAGEYSRQGIPDVSAVIYGRYYGFEVKRPYFGKLSKIQEQTIRQIQAAGGIAGVCIFPEDAERLIQEGLKRGGNFDEKIDEETAAEGRKRKSV